MKNVGHILTIVNMVVMVILIIMISLQNKSAGLSNVFGGGMGVDATMVFGVIFVGLSVTAILLSK